MTNILLELEGKLREETTQSVPMCTLLLLLCQYIECISISFLLVFCYFHDNNAALDSN